MKATIKVILSWRREEEDITMGNGVIFKGKNLNHTTKVMICKFSSLAL